ncbi:MAG: hypothetical protein K9K78_05000 [Spirochaetales bacterium]|nr:hypothetical protein [Spirochaetales bacterium]
MKEKSVFWKLTALAVLLMVFSFSGCELVDTEAQAAADFTRGGASNARSNDTDLTAEISKEKKPKAFEASITVYQNAADTAKVGEGIHYRTNDEILKGSVDSSDWDALDEATVEMTNFTNFNSLPLYPAWEFPSDISGTNHSSVEITLKTGEILNFTANGKLEGTFPVMAEVDMNFSLTGKSEQTIVKNVQGKLSGNFVWDTNDDTQVSQGIFKLEGFYK